MTPIKPGYCDQCAVSLPEDAHGHTRFCKTCRPPRVRKTVIFRNAEGQHACQECHASLTEYAHLTTRFCRTCANKRNTLSRQRSAIRSGTAGVYAVMRLAIRHGFLAPVKTLKCVDCGKAAECYDHRDYNKPLAVAPVCIGCNVRRGPAIPFLPSN